MATRRFADRRDAGRALAAALAGRAPDDAVVLGLPRGGVPVAFEVAATLGRPLDVLVVRKLGVPGHPELAMGALASGDVRVLNPGVLAEVPDADRALRVAERRERRELERRERTYRAGRTPVALRGRAVLLVDDGLATGATMRVAARAARDHGVARVDVAVPVGAPDVCAALAREVDGLCCLHEPRRLGGVGAWYDDFTQTTDDEVRRLLREAAGTG